MDLVLHLRYIIANVGVLIVGDVVHGIAFFFYLSLENKSQGVEYFGPFGWTKISIS